MDYTAIVVGNDLSTQPVIVQTLTQQGYAVRACQTAETFWPLHDAQLPSLIVVDLPANESTALCGAVRKRNVLGKLQILATARADAQALLNAGADDLVALPVEPAQLNLRIAVARQKAGAPASLGELRFKRLFDSSIMGVFCWLKDGTITEANDAFLKMVRYSRDDLYNGKLNWRNLTPPDLLHVSETALTELLKVGEYEPYEKEYIAKDGKHVPILVCSAILDRNRGEGVAFILDQTQRRNLEKQLRHAGKMDAVGQLAGGIAHDFNNMLTIVLGRSDLLLSRLDGANPLRRDVELIQKTGERAAALTRQLLAFSRSHVTSVVTLDLNAVISEMEQMLVTLAGDKNKVTFETEPNLPRIRADRGQIEQVIMNIVVNARDAMPSGGRVMVKTCREIIATTSDRPDLQPGDYVVLTIADTGIGIEPQNMPRIFEPFFTTKPMGGGTGLGLSTVYGIVKQTGGHIVVASHKGEGAVFSIYLPSAPEQPAAAAQTGSPGVKKGEETILVVEDEADVRDVVVNFLKASGYNVLAAESAERAQTLTQQHSGPIHLLLTDVVMPKTNGKQLATALQQTLPKLRVVFMSGYTSGALPETVGQAGVAFVQKPFTRAGLCEKIREVLDAPER